MQYCMTHVQTYRQYCMNHVQSHMEYCMARIHSYVLYHMTHVLSYTQYRMTHMQSYVHYRMAYVELCALSYGLCRVMCSTYDSRTSHQRSLSLLRPCSHITFFSPFLTAAPLIYLTYFKVMCEHHHRNSFNPF